MVENKQKTGQSQYNLNESDFLLLADLQREGFYIRNHKKNYPEALERWKSVRMLIDARFEEDETKKLDDIQTDFWKRPKEINIPKNLSDYSAFGNVSPRTNYINQIRRRYQLNKLDEYITYLRQLMKIYRICMTDVEKKIRLD